VLDWGVNLADPSEAGAELSMTVEAHVLISQRRFSRMSQAPKNIGRVAVLLIALAYWSSARAQTLQSPAAAPAQGSAAPQAAASHSPASASAQTVQGAGVASAGEAARGESHVIKSGESVASLAWRYLPKSVYMRRSDLEAAIRQANNLGKAPLKPGETIMIPGIPGTPIVDKPVTAPKDFDARGIYLTGFTAGSAHGLDLAEKWKQAGGNTVVFDIKDYDGELRVPFDNPYASRNGVTIRNLGKYIHYLHSLQLHAVARIALFRDARLAASHPELDVRSRRTGKPWLENGKLAWLDPSNRAVQDYNLALAQAVAAEGADEIQFDYVRFPTEGDQADARFSYQKEHPEWPRSKVITDFVARAYDELHPKGVLVSLDVFGVMGWARPVDLNHTGQNIAELARHCDVISPMIYPSHFFGMDGYKLPGDAPEHFISEALQRFAATTEGSSVVLRPWLQAFGWRTPTYSANYILTQVRVAKEQGGVGFLFWNARNDYSKPFAAMPEVRAESARYFGIARPGPAEADAHFAPSAPRSAPTARATTVAPPSPSARRGSGPREHLIH
jgi:hypothetical protein